MEKTKKTKVVRSSSRRKAHKAGVIVLCYRNDLYRISRSLCKHDMTEKITFWALIPLAQVIRNCEPHSPVEAPGADDAVFIPASGLNGQDLGRIQRDVQWSYCLWGVHRAFLQSKQAKAEAAKGAYVLCVGYSSSWRRSKREDGPRPDIQLGITGTRECVRSEDQPNSRPNNLRETVRAMCNREAFEESGLDIRQARVLWKGHSVERQVVKGGHHGKKGKSDKNKMCNSGKGGAARPMNWRDEEGEKKGEKKKGARVKAKAKAKATKLKRGAIRRRKTQ